MMTFSANSVTAGVVYIFGALTCLGCALLLVRGYMRSKMRLLLWSSVFFFALSADNIVIFFDLIVFPEIKFGLLRNLFTLGGLLLLIYGLIFESE